MIFVHFFPSLLYVYYEFWNSGERMWTVWKEHFDFEIYRYSPKGEIGKETMAEEKRDINVYKKLLCLPIEVTGSENHEW